MKLPDDIKIHIYTFLHMDDVKKIEKKKDIYLTLIKLENKTKVKICENIYRNTILNQCFHCINQLTDDYIMNICGICKYCINKEHIYPMYCNNCIKFKTKREFATRPCLICKTCSIYLGILPYS
jgi:hypothetical protein